MDSEPDLAPPTLTPTPLPEATASLAAVLPVGMSPSPILARLLRMADNYRRDQSWHQAIELYFTIIEQHPNTTEGRQARERLLTLCEGYEQQGSLRMARSIYERLLSGPGGQS